MKGGIQRAFERLEEHLARPREQDYAYGARNGVDSSSSRPTTSHAREFYGSVLGWSERAQGEPAARVRDRQPHARV